MEPDWWNQLAPDTSGESYGARNQCRLLRHPSQVSACSVPCWRVRERTPAKALQLTCGALFGHCRRSSSSSNPSKSLQSDCHLHFSDCHYTSAVLRRVLQVVSATGGFLSLSLRARYLQRLVCSECFSYREALNTQSAHFS